MQHNNRLGGDYPDPAVGRPYDGGPKDYGIKRNIDPRGFYDLDNVHSPSAPVPAPMSGDDGHGDCVLYPISQD